MIVGFADRATEDIFHGNATRWARSLPKPLWPNAQRKLDMLNHAAAIEDLRAPPSNHLEKLRGDRNGFWSIRVNQQYRLVFRFQSGNASEVSIVDYHR